MRNKGITREEMREAGMGETAIENTGVDEVTLKKADGDKAEKVMVYTYQQNRSRSFMVEVTARLVKWVESFR